MTAGERKIADQLLSLEPKEASHWLEDIDAGRADVPEGFSWHVFAEGAALKAGESVRRSREQALEWARLAITAYDRLADAAIGAHRDAFLLSSMMLRASMIAKFGACAGDLVLDSARLVNWFFQSQVLPYETVARETLSWRTLPVEKVRELRATKNRLNVIQVLCQSGQFTPDEAVCRWLDLREALP